MAKIKLKLTAVWRRGIRLGLLLVAAVTPARLAAAFPVVAMDQTSKTLTALPPAEANEAARHDLLSALQPAGTYGYSGLVPGALWATFVTWPYQTDYWRVCQEDRVTLTYGPVHTGRVGRHPITTRRPQGVATQPLFNVQQLPVLATDETSTICDRIHPGSTAHWIAADSAREAVRGLNLFRKAEDALRAGSLTPDTCARNGQDACRQWILSLDDASKIDGVEACASSTDDEGCYEVRFESGDILTVTGAMLPDRTGGMITTGAIKSISVAAVEYVIE